MSPIHIGLNEYYHDPLQSVMSEQQDAPIILRGHYPVIPVAGLMTQHLRMIVFLGEALAFYYAQNTLA